MQTKILKDTEEDLREAGRILASGGLVAFPTETVYGLGADALNAEAVAAVYEAKGRPSDNPMIVHISDISGLAELTAEPGEMARKLAAAFWPGPLTLVMKKLPAVPDRTTGGLDTVAVRMPESRIAAELIRYAGVPVAAPSANISGRPSPTRFSDVVFDLDGKIDAIIDGPDCAVGIESTVVDVTGEAPVILRPGIITAELIKEQTGLTAELDPSLKQKPQLLNPQAGSADMEEDFKPRSPGMKYKHYAPEAEMLIIEGERHAVENEIAALKAEHEARGKKVGVILFADDDAQGAAHDLFARLRDMDARGVDLILAGGLSEANGVGFAVMNRMFKSAGYNIRQV